MLAELVLSYYLTSNMSSHLNVDTEPFISTEVRLNLEHSFTPKLSFTASPYIQRAGIVTKIVGLEFELMYQVGKNVKLGGYHHSAHTQDMDGRRLEVDGVRARWCIGC